MILVVGVIAFFVCIILGFSLLIPIVFKIVFKITDKIYDKVYDKGVSDTLERLNGRNKTNK